MSLIKVLIALILSVVFARGDVEATVMILVVDYLGNSVPARMVSFNLKGTQAEYAKHFQGLKGKAIPLGKYEFVLQRAESPGAKIWGLVEVSELEQTYLQITSRDPDAPAADYGPFFSWRFKLEPVPKQETSGEPLRIRLNGLVSGAQEDHLVEPSGEFRIHSMIQGPFLITVLRGDQILHIQAMSFHNMFPREPVTIRMPSEAPSVIHFRPPR